MQNAPVAAQAGKGSVLVFRFGMITASMCHVFDRTHHDGGVTVQRLRTMSAA